MYDYRMSRRGMLKGMGIVAAGAAFGVGLPRFAQAGAVRPGYTPRVSRRADENRPWYELGIIGDPVMDEQLLFYLGATWSGMSDIGECLDTASRITPDDLSTWPREWRKTADRVLDMADRSMAAGHRISAGQAYLRASNYYRAALMHHSDPKAPETLPMARTSIDCFGKAVELLSLPAQSVQIPYEGVKLPGWFWRSPVAGEKAPLLIVHQGRDAWAEDNKFIADACVSRGYHCLQVHCPGQGMALRELGLPFRPDWEKVITPVVDFALEQPGVDPARIALMGISMGGALAPRAAAFEKRIKICIADPGVLNWGKVVTEYLSAASPELAAAVNNVASDPQTFNEIMDQLMQVAPQMQWAITDEMWKHGAKTPAELVTGLLQFNNEPIVDRISCMTLVMDGEAEAWSVGQAKPLYDALKGPKDYMLFTAAEAGQVHTQTGAHALATHRLFDWLDEHI